jgi:hypothetical protein
MQPLAVAPEGKLGGRGSGPRWEFEKTRVLLLSGGDRRKTPIAERVARGEEVIGYRTPVGDLQIVPTPAGTQGYDDLRRRANREYLGEGVRADVASINDLSRMLAAREREQDLERLLAMRRLHELERSVGRGIDLGL